MYIALLSDPHTGSASEFPYGIDLRRNFISVLKKITLREPDILLLGGDLCFKDPQTDTYRWQKEKLDETGIPYYIVAGNHDDSIELQAVFNHLPETIDGELYYEHHIEGHRLLFLDSSRGYLSSGQKEWLDKKIRENHRQVVIMHHPPTLMNVPYMDQNHALKDREEVMSILGLSPNPIDIYCGHYHVEKTVYTGNLRIHITPSCYFQIDQYHQDFAVDHHQIAYRMIYLSDKNDWSENQVHYLPGCKVEGPTQEEYFERK